MTLSLRSPKKTERRSPHEMMLAIACLVAVIAVAAAGPAPQHFYSAKFEEPRGVKQQGETELTEHTFRTRVDHFRPQDGRVVDFTYTQNLEHYQNNGPIFIYVGDGGVYTNEWIQGGLMFDIARQVNAALATADHRYFGHNRPTPTASFEDLQFLTVDQALGDLSVLISTIRADLGTTGRVILWGTGYGASLATHARKKFPHLVDGVWASSGYFRAEAIDTVYYDSLSSIIRQHGGDECAERVNTAFTVLQQLIESAESDYLQQRLRLCNPLDTTNHQEVALVVARFIELIAEYIHFNHLNGIQNFCRDMNAIPADPLNSLVRFIEYAYGGRPECVTVNYDAIIESVSQTNWTSLTPSGAVYRAIEYIYCTQLGGLKVTSDYVLDIFPNNLITAEYQYQFCADIFGEQYNATLLEGAVELLNLNLGGQDQVISNVVFSNAGLDPYIHHGIADYDVEDSAVVFLRYDAAGADLRSVSVNDSVDLTNAKTTIQELVIRWVQGRNRA